MYCQHAFWRDPHSAFFNHSVAYQMRYTETRKSQAREFIAAAESPEYAPRTQSTDPLICAVVISVKRSRIQYLNETVGSALEGLDKYERNALSLQVLFADTDPSIHPDYERHWLNTVDYASGYNISSEQLKKLEGYKRDQKVRAKALFDYTYALDQCLNKTDAPYIGIFEDDIVFADSWLVKTIQALADIEKKGTDWLYLRIFWTDVMLGWDRDIDPWYTNPILLYILALGFTYTAAFGLHRRIKHSRSQTDVNVLYIILCVTVPAIVTLIFMIGQNSLFPLDGLQRMDVKGCCTQSLIFSRPQVSALAARLRSVHPDQTDLIMEEYADEAGLARFALAPQLVQHVGLVSSRGTRRRDSRSNWAFYFEDFDPEKLRWEHEQLSNWATWRPESSSSALSSWDPYG